MMTLDQMRLAELVEQIERSDFVCEAGPLYNFNPWHDLRAMAGLDKYSDQSVKKRSHTPDVDKTIDDILSGEDNAE